MKRALLVVDMQNDFLPGGALAIPEGDKIITPINRLMRLSFDAIVATKDFHPVNHCSFASRWRKKAGEQVLINGMEQILWPDHCVQNTSGAELAANLDTKNISFLVLKGTQPDVESYSAFFDNKRQHSTGLELYLLQKDIKKIYVTGIATNFCVLYSVRDAISLGFEVVVVADACQGIELHPGDVAAAFATMEQQGALLTTTQEIIEHWQ